ncbi:hypothetical protein ACET3Z_031215 [Daucus carota]
MKKRGRHNLDSAIFRCRSVESARSLIAPSLTVSLLPRGILIIGAYCFFTPVHTFKHIFQAEMTFFWQMKIILDNCHSKGSFSGLENADFIIHLSIGNHAIAESSKMADIKPRSLDSTDKIIAWKFPDIKESTQLKAIKLSDSFTASYARNPSGKVSLQHLLCHSCGSRQVIFEGHEAPVYSVCPHFKENIQFVFSTAIDGKIKAWLYDCLGSRVDYDAPGCWCTTMAYSGIGCMCRQSKAGNIGHRLIN